MLYRNLKCTTPLSLYRYMKKMLICAGALLLFKEQWVQNPPKLANVVG